MEKKKDIFLSEIFMAKCGIGNKGFDRCFHGSIRREHDAEGNPVVYGKIKVGAGYIYATGKDQWELGEKLDQLVVMIIDSNLHADAGKTEKIAETPYFLN